MKFAVLVVIALLTASCAHAFSVGDVIWTMKRTQLGKDQTAWSDVLGKDSPRFGQNRQAALPMGLVVKESIRLNEQYKIMFSFANDQFVTPWIVVSDGQGKALNSIVFQFTHADGAIVGMKWELDYNDGEHHGIILPNLIVVYSWEERASTTVTFAVNTVFLVATIFTLATFSYIIAMDDHSVRYDIAMRKKYNIPLTADQMPKQQATTRPIEVVQPSSASMDMKQN